ncbi:hypothetical protein [Georgenia sp. SUBG003]|uniref:hypothetical protein n=1 Tax=Georgenia sp. SUBG003 TaxID=1497974 RepID=UPI0004D63451|nr:hypothetical protein DA06_10255 [Georgenia sp. SUBG003]
MTSRHDVRRSVLHAVRLLGYAGSLRVSERAGVPAVEVDDALLDAQAAGQVAWSRFEDDGGWSLTESGKTLGEKLLAEELEGSGARPVVESVMAAFEPLNRVVADACTRWQLAELGISEPPARLADVIGDLSRAAESWAVLEEQLVRQLPRFGGYHERFCAAVDRARADPAWVAATDRESAHRVWFELHEDLLATLGRPR